MNYKERRSEARSYYERSVKRVKTDPVPKGQKYPPGTRVRISDDLGESMSHFEKGVNATVLYTYAHAYGGEDVKSYCLDVDGHGEISWYQEHQLTQIEDSHSNPNNT